MLIIKTGAVLKTGSTKPTGQPYLFPNATLKRSFRAVRAARCAARASRPGGRCLVASVPVVGHAVTAGQREVVRRVMIAGSHEADEAESADP